VPSHDASSHIRPTLMVGTLRLTTRQTYQLHGILKTDLKQTFQSVIKNMGKGLYSSTSQLNLSHSDTKTHPTHPVTPVHPLNDPYTIPSRTPYST